MNKLDLRKPTSIDEDFALWAVEQAALVRAGKFDRTDSENIAGELEYLGNSPENEIESRLNVLIAHLLKWQFQPSKRSNSWKATLLEQRTQIARIIRRSPSLKGHPESVLDEEYRIGKLKASGETNLPESAFPEGCPYSIEQILDLSFYPDAE
jgi:Domain of unknown function DUF29